MVKLPVAHAPRRGIFVAGFQSFVIHPQAESHLFQQATYSTGADRDFQPPQLVSDFSDSPSGPFQMAHGIPAGFMFQ
jgi:hypothetical protein